MNGASCLTSGAEGCERKVTVVGKTVVVVVWREGWRHEGEVVMGEGVREREIERLDG